MEAHAGTTSAPVNRQLNGWTRWMLSIKRSNSRK